MSMPVELICAAAPATSVSAYSAAQMLGALFCRSLICICWAKPALAKISPYSIPVASPAILCVFQRMFAFVSSYSPETDACLSPSSSVHVQFSHHSNESYSEYVIVPFSASKSRRSLVVVTV